MTGPSGRAREVAFGGHPEWPVRVGPGMSPRDRWLVAVALGGQGFYAAAAAELARLLTDPRVPAAVAAHAAVTRASHRRQQGGHAHALADDALGLRLASGAGSAPGERSPGDPDGTDRGAARIDALVGLAADAVGLGAPSTTVRLLDVAARAAAEHPSWRPSVRLEWVRAESALATGRPAQAVEHAAAAAARSRAAGSVRHVLKSRLVLAVARGAAGCGARTETVAELDAVAAECDRLGLLPLRWPCALAAADLLVGPPDGRRSANDGVAHSADRSPNDRVDGATRRRHAAIITANVMEQRSDPIGKRLLGVSLRDLRRIPLL